MHRACVLHNLLSFCLIYRVGVLHNLPCRRVTQFIVLQHLKTGKNFKHNCRKIGVGPHWVFIVRISEFPPQFSVRAQLFLVKKSISMFSTGPRRCGLVHLGQHWNVAFTCKIQCCKFLRRSPHNNHVKWSCFTFCRERELTTVNLRLENSEAKATNKFSAVQQFGGITQIEGEIHFSKSAVLDFAVMFA